MVRYVRFFLGDKNKHKEARKHKETNRAEADFKEHKVTEESEEISTYFSKGGKSKIQKHFQRINTTKTVFDTYFMTQS